MIKPKKGGGHGFDSHRRLFERYFSIIDEKCFSNRHAAVDFFFAPTTFQVFFNKPLRSGLICLILPLIRNWQNRKYSNETFFKRVDLILANYLCRHQSRALPLSEMFDPQFASHGANLESRN